MESDEDGSDCLQSKPISYSTYRRKVRARVASHLETIVIQDRENDESHISILQLDCESGHTSGDLQEASCQQENSEAAEINTPHHAHAKESENASIDSDCDTDRDSSVIYHACEASCSSGSDLETGDYKDDKDLDLALAKWAVHNQETHTSVSELLSILRHWHPSLPVDPRTLLKTKTMYDIKDIEGGEYYHFGLLKGVLSKLSLYPVLAAMNPDLLLQVNIDGLPLFKSSSMQFWPILGRLEFGSDHMREPFIIGLFCGTSKPKSIAEFLSDFIEETNTLKEEGFSFNGIHFSISVSAFICDAPARSFVKNVKSHAAYYGCEKCRQKGDWIGKMTFPLTDAPLRTDEQFNEMTDAEHHLGPSPLSALSIGLVSQFPLDYMHLVCLGMMRRLLVYWIKGPLKNRVGNRTVNMISEALVALRAFIPKEFARKPRSLLQMERWKATEFRQFLLYTGPVVLHGKLSDALYSNFMTLYVGILILASPMYCMTYSDYAHELLVHFVTEYSFLYGRDAVVYNAHCLTHLAKDVKKFGHLDTFSAFPFENFLGKLKRMVRKPLLPLQQVIRRLSEQTPLAEETKSVSETMLKKEHSDGPLPAMFPICRQFGEVVMENMCITKFQGDNHVQIGKDICMVRNISKYREVVYIVYEKFVSKNAFYKHPLDSRGLGIYIVSNLSGILEAAPLSSVTTKYVLLPYRGDYVATPLLH